MRTRTILVLLLAACSCLPMVASSQEKSKKKAAANKAQAKKKANQAVRPIAAAKAFLSTLNAEQKSMAVLEYGSEQRVGWHFIPLKTRKGLPLNQMEAEQQAAARSLLKSVVSALGNDKATIIMQLESVLLTLEGPKVPAVRDPLKYYFTVFGSPAANQDWGLSIEGHHLSLNFSLTGNQIVDSTPQFMGANPAELKASYGDFKQGLRVLADEEQLAFELINSLDEVQLAKATLAGDTPKEIRGAGEPQPPTEPARGIAASELTSTQQATLRKLMEAYSSKMKPAVVQQRWKLIDEAGFDKVKFAWSGARKPGGGHYYVVQGATFVIEFVNVQADAAGNPANHIHCVWRDLQGDFNLPIAGK